MKFYIVFFYSLVINYSTAQHLFDNSIELNDGVYMSVEELINNKPSVKLEDVELNFIDGVFDTEHAKVIDISIGNHNINNKIWGICIEGAFYVRLAETRKKALDKLEDRFIKDNTFSKIIIKGSISVFSLPIFVVFSNNMGAFGGVAAGYGSMKKTNSPSSNSNNVSDGTKTKWYFISLENKNVYLLELESFLNYIQNDNELTEMMKNDKHAKKKLLYYVNKYNERNPFYIQPEN